MLVARELGKRFGSRWIFRRVSFELGKGDSLLVTGRNGAGKSTLLKALAGLMPLSEGAVERPAEVRTGLGYAALDGRLYPALTAREHWEFAARARGIQAPEDLSPYGLGKAWDEPAAALSTGQRARLRLALAVQAAPAVLLLDEPSASLDEDGRALVARLVEEQIARGALIVATNDPLDRRYGHAELALDA